MASDFCTDDVRERLIYIEPAREDVVIGFNPLLYDTLGHAYYKVSRAVEVVLKGWASQNIEEMPRLARWLFNSFYACALLGLTIADSVHLLLPGSPYHKRLLRALPSLLQYEWQELIRARSAEVSRMLESARNRLKPYFESPILRSMFGATTNQLDVLRFMREGRIVLLNLSPGNRLPEQVADAIGGLVLNEVLSAARSLPLGERYPTYLFLDEFQRFIGPDVEAAIPEVRQLGVKLVLSHQSFSQLKRGDYDLTTMIFQAQNRMIFGLQGEDADLLAHELASIQYDPRRIKDEVYSRRQRIAGHRIAELGSWSQTESQAQNWLKTYGESWSRGQNIFHGRKLPTYSDQQGFSRIDGSGQGGASSTSVTHGSHQTLVPIHEDYWEMVNRTYWTFEDDRQVWARDIRRLVRGTAFVRLVDDHRIHHVDIRRSAPGHLAWDLATLRRELPEEYDAVLALVERNFQSKEFSSPATIEAEQQARLTALVGGTVDEVPRSTRPTGLAHSPPSADPFSA